MKWNHARKGIIEGEIIRDLGEWVDIQIMNKVRMGFGDPFSSGFRGVYAGPDSVIRVRKSLLQPLQQNRREQ